MQLHREAGSQQQAAVQQLGAAPQQRAVRLLVAVQRRAAVPRFPAGQMDLGLSGLPARGPSFLRGPL